MNHNHANDAMRAKRLPGQRIAVLPTGMELFTIPFSHFCEKARWGLAYYGIPYKEHKYLPMLHVLPMLFQSRGKGRADRHSSPASTPMLLTDKGERLCDSSQILTYLSSRFGRPSLDLYPHGEVRDLEAQFSKTIGPDARRIAYYYILQHQEIALDISRRNVGGLQPRLLNAIYGVWYPAMCLALTINEKQMTKSLADLEVAFGLVEKRLADGRAYLCGRHFTAADLTFAALSAPVVWPSRADGFGADLGPWETLPEPLRSLVEGFRARPGGQFALRMFREHKPKLQWV